MTFKYIIDREKRIINIITPMAQARPKRWKEKAVEYANVPNISEL